MTTATTPASTVWPPVTLAARPGFAAALNQTLDLNLRSLVAGGGVGLIPPRRVFNAGGCGECRAHGHARE